MRPLAALLLVAACGGAPTAPVAPPRVAAPKVVALEPGDRTVTVGDQPIVVHIAGRAGAPVCVVWPGGPGIDSAYLRSPALERELRLVYVDPVGTGASGRLADPAGYTRARWVADLEGLRAALGLETMCLIGHSHGGMIALSYALAHPERVSRLVLYDTAARTDADFARAAQANLAALKGRPWFDAASAGFRTEPHSDDEATATFQRIAPAYVADWEGRGAELAPLLARSRATAEVMTARDPAPYDVRSLLPTLRVPTLVLVGRHDFLCGPPFADELARGIPGARLVTFERSGHLAHLEEPDAFAAAIASFSR